MLFCFAERFQVRVFNANTILVEFNLEKSSTNNVIFKELLKAKTARLKFIMIFFTEAITRGSISAEKAT